VAFKTLRPAQLRFLVEFARAWKALPRFDQETALRDPWAFKQVIAAVPVNAGYSQREALLHLVFPDTFEPMISQDHKQRILTRFADLLDGPSADPDRALARIRQVLTQRIGGDFGTFYDDRVRWRWNTDYAPGPWDRFAFWASRFYERDDFDRLERDYKLQIADRLRAARESLLAGDPDWPARVKAAFGAPNNLTFHISHARFLQWCGSSPDAPEALRILWGAPPDHAPPIREFLARVPTEGIGGRRGTRLNIASYLGMAAGPERFPVYRQTPLASAFRLTAHPPPPDDADEGQVYEHALGFFDEICEQMGLRGIRLRDRLDAQSLVWCLTRWKDDEDPIASWPDRDAFVAYRGSTPANEPEEIEELDAPADANAADSRPFAAWLFEGNPVANRDLLGHLAKARPGDVDYWRVSRYRNDMRPGDPAVVWIGGPNAGIYALGEIVGEPYDRELPLWDRVDVAAEATEKAINVRYTHVPSSPIRRADVADHPSLRDLGVLGIARHTNYRVTLEQWAAILELVGDAPSEGEPVPAGYHPPPFGEIRDRVATLGLRVSDRTLRRYHLALQTRGFVILSGLSGAGKTWLAEAYADAVGARRLTAPVAPNWTSNEDLLGYFNPLGNQYHDTAVSRFLRDADHEHRRAEAAGVDPVPYHLVLDEMNLARVEYYFARFLSTMEVRARAGEATIELGPDDLVRLTHNLKVVGTVNVDETTHGFADKVYDRAQLIEMDAPRAELAAHLGDAVYAQTVLDVWETVHDVAPFAFRVLDEIAAYVRGAEQLGVPWQEALDEQLLQKVLPKLKGAATRVERALSDLAALTEDDFPLTHAKAARMLADAQLHGFASYF
jgi:hypothetical protein